jgi:hypothetical protein
MSIRESILSTLQADLMFSSLSGYNTTINKVNNYFLPITDIDPVSNNLPAIYLDITTEPSTKAGKGNDVIPDSDTAYGCKAQVMITCYLSTNNSDTEKTGILSGLCEKLIDDLWHHFMRLKTPASTLLNINGVYDYEVQNMSKFCDINQDIGLVECLIEIDYVRVPETM